MYGSVRTGSGIGDLGATARTVSASMSGSLNDNDRVSEILQQTRFILESWSLRNLGIVAFAGLLGLPTVRLGIFRLLILHA